MDNATICARLPKDYPVETTVKRVNVAQDTGGAIEEIDVKTWQYCSYAEYDIVLYAPAGMDKAVAQMWHDRLEKQARQFAQRPPVTSCRYEGPHHRSYLTHDTSLYFVSPQIDFDGDSRPDAVWVHSNQTFSYCTPDNKIHHDHSLQELMQEELRGEPIRDHEMVWLNPTGRTQQTELEYLQTHHTLKVGDILLQADDFATPVTVPGQGTFVIWNFDYSSGTPSGTSYEPYWPKEAGPFFWPDKVLVSLLPAEKARHIVPLKRKRMIAERKWLNGGYEATPEDQQVSAELRQQCEKIGSCPQLFLREMITLPAGEVAKLVRAGK